MEAAPDSKADARWQTLPLQQRLSPAVLAEILDGGQAFRWNRRSDREWSGIFDQFAVRLRVTPTGGVEWSGSHPLPPRCSDALLRYFDEPRNATDLADTLPWRSDPHLARCRAAFPGLRILRQPFGETLLGFLCSATKQIVQIKQMLALLADRHGVPIASPEPGKRVCRLPTWLEIAALSEAELRACQLGFRARYIHTAARFLAANPNWLDETEAAPYPAAKERLCSLAGVGEKVADCVLLFGAGRLEAFPVDVWIIKAMAQRYGLTGWSPSQMAHFGRVHFGELAGLAQQYLFAYERAVARNRLPSTPASPTVS